MATQVEKTPNGIVIRIRRGTGECSYRKSFGGSWAMSSRDKPQWSPLNAIDVPATALRVIAEMAERGARN